MIDFITMLLECDDFEILLGDLYQPVCAGLVFVWGSSLLCGVISLFNLIVSGIFRTNK